MKRLLRSKLTLTLAAFVMIAAAIVVPLSGNIIHSHAASSFNIVSSPSPGISNQLRGVTSISANNAWVVGWTSSTGSNPFQTLIEHWNGTTWSQQTAPSPGVNDNHLIGVKALSATNIWAVGDYMDANQENVLIEHSTDGGSTWIQDTNSYTGKGGLFGIDGDPSSGDAWAVGTDGSGNALTLHLVNGHFSFQANVNPNSRILLRSVSEHNSNDIWAVGTNFSSANLTTFTMHYDGNNWTTYTSPNPSAGDNELYGVTAIGPNDAWAVGFTNFLTHWDGTSWSTPISLTVGVDGDLETVAATSSQDIWAAGGYTDPSNPNLGLSVVWHSSDSGTTWEQVPVESPPNTLNSTDNHFHGMTIDTTTDNIWAVSDYTQLVSQNMSIGKTLIEQYTPSPPPTVTVQKVLTAYGNNNIQTSFTPDHAIQYEAQVNNTNSTSVTATFTFVATGPQQIFSWSGSQSVASGTPTITQTSTVPSTAPAGTYTLTVTVTYNGVSSSGQSQFTVSAWGVDSSDSITSNFYNQITQTFGKPEFFGRYIGDPLTSYLPTPQTPCTKTNGQFQYQMTAKEVTTARMLGLAILPIYFGYRPTLVQGPTCGQNYAKAAIEFAQRAPGFGIRQGTAIFVDIEAGSYNGVPIVPDAAFIQGWYDTFNTTFTYTSPYDGKSYAYQAGYYKAGYYANTLTSANFDTPFCAAVSNEPAIGTNSFIWTPQLSVLISTSTTEANAPPYQPVAVSCPNQQVPIPAAWQYGQQGGQKQFLNVDLDQALANLPLWLPS